MDRYRRAAGPARLDALAELLGLRDCRPVADLGVGWSAWHGGWAFPMLDAAGSLIGVQVRTPEGEKRSLRGSLDLSDFAAAVGC